MERQPNLLLRNALKLISLGGALGIVLAIVSHYSAAILSASGPIGAFIALVFGSLYGLVYAESYGQAARGGALTGFGSAFTGILLAFILGDQPLLVLVGGSIGGAVAGALGGLLSCALSRRRSVAL
jgi:hypothetical protein